MQAISCRENGLPRYAEESSSASVEAFVGRQPIYDRDLNIFGYELLFRSDDRNAAMFGSGQEATLQVILNTFLEIGLDKVACGKPVFVNFTRDLIMQHGMLRLPADWSVLEVLEDIPFDEEVAAGLRAWKARGHRIALDDFVYAEAVRPMVELADFVKLDVQATGLAGLAPQLKLLRSFPVKLLAEKIDTREEFRQCRAMGFDYFQGYFLSKPEILKTKRIPVNRLPILSLLARCQDPEVDCRELATLIGQNVSLSSKLLQALNSALCSRRSRVNSIQEAVLLAGVEWISRLATMLLLSGLNDKPTACLAIALERARVCELLGEALQAPNQAQFYTAGLLSALDLLLDQSLDEALAALPLSEDIRHALLTHEGSLGLVLRAVLAYQQGEWDTVTSSGLDSRLLCDAYWRAAPYVEELRRFLALTRPANP
jgi:EAL and modified HD-GYP domain-containing signal transduction protein